MRCSGHVEVQNNKQQTIYNNKINKSLKNIFRTQSNIYDEVFYAKIVSGFLQKSSMIDT